MEIRLRTILLTLAGLLASMICMSAYGGGWSGRQVTKHLTHLSDSSVSVVGLYGPWNNPDFCDVDKKVVLHPDAVSSASFDESYALLVGAHLTGREIDLYLSGCTMIGSATVPIITAIKIY
jgi:hypothetical protein